MLLFNPLWHYGIMIFLNNVYFNKPLPLPQIVQNLERSHYKNRYRISILREIQITTIQTMVSSAVLVKSLSMPSKTLPLPPADMPGRSIPGYTRLAKKLGRRPDYYLNQIII